MWVRPVATAAVLAASAGALGGCSSYSSDYMPLEDGRARAVYRNDDLVMEVGGGLSPACEAALQTSGGLERHSFAAHSYSTGVWVPVYYGPRIVVVHRGVAPPPRRHAARGTSPHFGGSASSVPGHSGGSSSSGGSSGGLGGGDLKEGVVILAVLALIALPVITVGLAVGRPEPEEAVASVADRVNRFNDMARTPGSPCYVYGQPAAGGESP